MFTVQRNVALAPFTTFHIGGKANYFTKVNGALELASAVEYAENNGLSLCIFSGGSNILFSDKGFDGMVIQMTDKTIKISGEKILCGAGVSLLDVVHTACSAGLSGMEKLAGIPGSLGGAIRGNAGAFGVEIGSVVHSVKVYSMTSGMLQEYPREKCAFGYRTSIFKKNPSLIIISADLRLECGNAEHLMKTANETIASREAKHSQKAQCAGSFFMNPLIRDTHLLQEFEKDTGSPSKDGKLPAGWLIDHAGLRGKKIGGAMVSKQHPNYLVNTGSATAEDVLMLASLIKTRVRDELGVRLKEEVQFIGL
ncbi:MAG: UDP-N-acetylmuramate dehydrogenase [Candidatus Moranbacteria bacterium]|nr:UDP-N-acetylmuramate dehydrogenase [Candidatus Moranbacteria bacterium]MDD3965002.1 UDP-N-acetylmuramate dehydrogenase [Candidatus Moranbacteria bacterium]